MDTYRAFLAILISFVILIAYQYFFIGFGTQEVAEEKAVQEQTQLSPVEVKMDSRPEESRPSQIQTLAAVEEKPEQPAQPAREITVDTDLYTAVVTENGGAMKSFVLKKYRAELAKESAGVQIVTSSEKDGLPLKFSWGSVAKPEISYSSPEISELVFSEDDKANLSMKSKSGGLAIERNYVFRKHSYLMDMTVRVKNKSDQVLQGAAQIHQVNRPFRKITAASRFLFVGPAAFMNESLEEFKGKEMKDGPKIVQGAIDWAAYEGTYFMSAILPEDKNNLTLKMERDSEDEEAATRMTLSGTLDTLQPGEEKVYSYRVYLGPKKLSRLQNVGDNLDEAVNFGWFDVIAKPTLWLLNFFYGYFKNYGIAIILVTIIFKATFWPITQKGLKSMKNMQKLQPKMVKIKEKYKSDPAKMNQEVMNLYKTYKVNPLGGCLPMVLQIPIFFALYKVLLQCIELRHAPFMLWINDLSAPDRLWIGFDIPYLGGIPILTLLMGASMFLQQKMTPTTADPTQAKIMMFLPIVFTFMFVNFASGLVLYWFINNLLAILQQQMINRQQKA